MDSERRSPTHPGVILNEDWLKPLGFGPAEFARIWSFDQAALCDLVDGRKAVDAAMEWQLRLSLGTAPGYWLAKQDDYDARAGVRASGYRSDAAGYLQSWSAQAAGRSDATMLELLTRIPDDTRLS